MRTASLLAADAAIEGATGIALILAPGLVARLLFASDLDGSGVIMARVAGMGLAGLALACWPGRAGPDTRAALAGLLAYNVLAGIYLLLLGLQGARVGVLLWPGVLLHVLMAVLLARAWTSPTRAEAGR